LISKASLADRFPKPECLLKGSSHVGQRCQQLRNGECHAHAKSGTSVSKADAPFNREVGSFVPESGRKLRRRGGLDHDWVNRERLD
jgi:hypothetical protein